MIESGGVTGYREGFTGRVITLIIDSIAIVRNIDNVYTMGRG